MTTRGRRQEAEKDPWGLDSGLADDMDIEVKKSRFGFLDTYQNGEACLLIWEYESPDVESEYPIIWPLGAGWETNRDGTLASHPKRSRFVDTSFMGRLIKRSQDIGAGDTLKARGTPRDATIWEGMKLHMKRETIVFPGGAERGIPESTVHLMPVEFLGVTGGAAPRARTATARRTATPTTTEEEPDNALTDKLTDLARTLTLAQFQKAAMNIEEMSNAENRALLSDVLEDGPTGFWAKAQS